MDALYEATEVMEKVEALENRLDELVLEKDELKAEIQDSRRVFTGFQFSVSLLLFAYGLFYGLYFGKCM